MLPIAHDSSGVPDERPVRNSSALGLVRLPSGSPSDANVHPDLQHLLQGGAPSSGSASVYGRL